MNLTQRPVKISPIKGRADPVSGILLEPAEAKSILVLAHGAGAGMEHPFMQELATCLALENMASLRFQFPYMEDGKKRPDNPKLATATVRAAVEWAVKETNLPVFAAGKSFGGRMTTTAAAEGMIDSIKGIICFGFPLHPANKPSIERARHLKDVQAPLLFLQGTRDALADLTLMSQVTSKLPLATQHTITGADHGFAVLKSSGRNAKDVMQELTRLTRDFCEARLQ